MPSFFLHLQIHLHPQALSLPSRAFTHTHLGLSYTQAHYTHTHTYTHTRTCTHTYNVPAPLSLTHTHFEAKSVVNESCYYNDKWVTLASLSHSGPLTFPPPYTLYSTLTGTFPSQLRVAPPLIHTCISSCVYTQAPMLPVHTTPCNAGSSYLHLCIYMPVLQSF
jgi:hypothetical protein